MRIATLLLCCTAALAAAETPTFSRDVQPVFRQSCGGCHNAQLKSGGLDLSTYETLQRGGTHGPAIVAGKAVESRLYRMITHQVQPSMPVGGAKLAAGDIARIEAWINGGAPEGAPGMDSKAPVASRIAPRHPLKPQIFSLAYDAEGRTLALGGYREIRLADASTGRILATLSGHAEAVRAVSFSRQGFLVAAGGLPGQKGEVKVWNVAQRSVVNTWYGHTDCIYAAAISPDGTQVATASYDKLIKIWDVATGSEVRTLKDHIEAIYALAFTPDGKRLISGAADRTVKIWEPATGVRLYTLGEPADGINAIALDPSGKRVAAGGLDKTVRVWELGERSGTLVASLIAHEDAILRLAWSPDGRSIASASADHTIKILDATTLAEQRTLAPQSDWVNGLAFSPDGKLLAAGRYDGSLTLYPAHDDSERR